MGNNQPKPDAGDFSARLNRALDRVEGVPRLDHGRGAWIARMFKVSKMTGAGWVKGVNVPIPPRVKRMAQFCGVPFDWLYFGTGDINGSDLHIHGKDGVNVATSPSQPARSDWHKMRDAQVLLRHLGELRGAPELEHNPRALTIAYDFLLEFDAPMEESNVLDLTKKLAAKLRGMANDDEGTQGESQAS